MKFTIPTLMTAVIGAAVAASAATAAQSPRGERGDPPRTREEALERALDRFARNDLNDDGFLTVDELTGANSRRGRFIERMFERQDTNDDGFLSAAEVEEVTRERFDRIDTDGDGELSDAELEAARDARGRRRG